MDDRPNKGRCRLRVQVLMGALMVLCLAAAVTAGCARKPTQTPPASIPNAYGSIRTPAGTPPSFATLPPITPPPIVTAPVQLALPTAAPAASPTATVDPATAQPELQPACLVGTWQVADLTQALERSYQQSGAALQLQDVKGQALYSFDANGIMMLTFQGLAATFNGQVENRDVAVVQAIDGSGTARYQIDLSARHLVMSDFGGEGVLFTLDINGQRLAEGNLPVWQAFTSSLQGQNPPEAGQVAFSRAAITCQDDRMTIQAVSPLPGPVIVLERTR